MLPITGRNRVWVRLRVLGVIPDGAVMLDAQAIVVAWSASNYAPVVPTL